MSKVVDIYFNINQNRTAAFIFYKNTKNMYEMCKICLRNGIKLSTCIPVELCYKCAPTPHKCIELLNNKKEVVGKGKCHIKNKCSGCKLTKTQRFVGAVRHLVHTNIIDMAISQKVPVKLRDAAEKILEGKTSIRFDTVRIVDAIRQTKPKEIESKGLEICPPGAKDSTP